MVCRKYQVLKRIEVSDANTEVIEYVQVKLGSQSDNNKKETINIIGIYREPTHGFRAIMITETEQSTRALLSTKLNILCGDVTLTLEVQMIQDVILLMPGSVHL